MHCAVIDSGTAVGAGASLDLNFGGAPRIAYRGAGGHLAYARYISPTLGNCGPSNTWQCDVIDASAVVSHSIALHAPKCLLCGTSATTSIAYYDLNTGNVKYAQFKGSGGNCGPANPIFTWQCEVIDNGGFLGNNVGQYPSLDVNSAGLATVAYYDATEGKLKVAYQHFQTFLPLLMR